VINEHCIQYDDIQVDLIELRVNHAGKDIHFTLTELRLLLAFLIQPYRIFSREELIRCADTTSISALNVLITRLRLLLGYEYIFTIRGGGYVFDLANRMPVRAEREVS
jgi:DNA-binding response OmpR family regulator